MPAVLSDPVRDVLTAVEKLRADDRLLTSPEMLLGDIEVLKEAITGIESAVVSRLRSAYHLDATTELTGRATKQWLVEEQLLSGPEAGRLMRLMRRLPDYPLTEAAYADRLISTQHVAAILTALGTLRSDLREVVEPHLIERARHYPPEEIGGFVDELLEALGLDKDSDVRRERRNTERGFDIGKTLGGARSVAGTLTPDVGEKLEAALALAAQKAGPDDERTPRQRRHDALGEIADAYAARQQPNFGGAPRAVIVTVDLETLEDRLREKWITLPSGARISADTARRLACDAAVIPVVLGGNGDVVDIGQAGHEFTTAIRRAAYVRDGGKCAFPRCTHPVAEVHHIVFRRHDGPNSLDNAAWLCAYHHWLAHEGGWTLRRAGHGGYLWTNKYGHHVERFLERHPGTA